MLSDDMLFQIWRAESAYFKAMENARLANTNAIKQDFMSLENWRDENILEWKTRSAARQEAANQIAGRLTAAKQLAVRKVWGINANQVLRPERLKISALRPGLESSEPFQKVANELYYNLSRGKQIKDSLSIADDRLDAVTKSLFQEAALEANNQNVIRQLTGFMRVLSGATDHCNLCILAASRVYNARNSRGEMNKLKPIHDRCTCIVREIYDSRINDNAPFDEILRMQQNLSPDEKQWLLENTVKGQDFLDDDFMPIDS